MMMTMVTAIRTTMLSTMTTMTMMMIDLWQCYLYTFSHDTAPAMCTRRDAAQPSWPSNWRSVRLVVSIGGTELEATADTSKLARSC